MTCAGCRTDLARVKLIIGGQWLCSDCAYELEHGEVERRPWPPRTTAPPQDERLFPLPPPVPLRERRAS
jgi:hypothetical protein